MKNDNPALPKLEKHLQLLARFAPVFQIASLKLKQDDTLPLSGSAEEIILWVTSLTGQENGCFQEEILTLIQLWYPMDKTVFSRKLKGLIKANLIVSMRHSEDNRKNLLRITSKGKNHLAYLMHQLAEAVHEILQDVKRLHIRKNSHKL